MITMVYEIFSIFQSQKSRQKKRMVHQLTPAVQWRCCKKNGNYPYNHTVEPCHYLVRKNCAVQRWFSYPNISVESDKAHIQGRSSSSRRMPIVLGLKFNKVSRSVISRVIMRGRYESASTIGCPEHTWMLINMM